MIPSSAEKMRHVARNTAVLVSVAALWIFFFAPNPWVSFFEIQGHERLPRVVFFGLPVVLAAISIFALIGSLPAKIALALCMPLFSLAIFVFMWTTGVYGGEDLMLWGLMLLLSTLLYIGGVSAAALISKSDNRVAAENAVVIAGVITASFILLWISFRLAPLDATPVVNVVAIPLLLGVSASFLLTGHLLLKLALLVLVPVMHVLVSGGVDAKPGLEKIAALAELVVLWAGCLISHIVRSKMRPEQPAPRGHSRNSTALTE
jgi:hypothetical protein